MMPPARQVKTLTAADYSTPLFPDLELPRGEKTRKYKRVSQAIWTEHKAHFIQQYLRYFVQVTKHGAYIDGFAGPQYPDRLDAWSAALVLDSEPKWLRRFFLCELSAKGFQALKKLVARQPEIRDKNGRKISRTVELFHGDFNVKVDDILGSGRISQKEATFCLLDQRTFECHWKTVEKLANYKLKPNHKIELLYFLGVGWLHRAFSGIKNGEKALNWWGSNEWRELRKRTAWEVAEITRKRFENELGYKFSAAYPIFDREKGNKIMYYMIHASDHDEAPALMIRSHRKAVRSLPKETQRPFTFDEK
jgi:three-Cys-motif partner protein